MITEEHMSIFITSVLSDILEGRDLKEHINPVKFFDDVKIIKEGRELPENDPDIIAHNAECSDMDDLFWKGSDKMCSRDLLVDILHKADLSIEEVEKIAEILTMGIYKRKIIH